MKQKVSQKYKPLFINGPRYFILMGGRGAGRSTVASQYVTANLVGSTYFRCAIMRYIFGDIRNSIYQEIKDRAEDTEIKDQLTINDSTMTIRYGKNSVNAVGFKKSSSEQKSKLKSLANYNCVIIEEADEIPEEDFIQLDDSLRTIKADIKIILLLNPPAKSHWIIQRWFDLGETEESGFYEAKLKASATDTVHISSTYLDNIANIASHTIKNYEGYKVTKPSHYYNMVKGYVPEVVRGKIYSGWIKIPLLPHEARLERYGLDFGYSNDPTAIIAVYRHNGGIIFDEITFTKKLINSQIAAILLNQPSAVVVADSAEPKSIDEIKLHGVPIVPSTKGSDSIRAGVDKVKEYRISVTEQSKNIWNEYENYSWMEDKEGKTLNEPKPGYDHSMDALRYAIVSLEPEVDEQKALQQRAQREQRRERAAKNAGL